MYLNSVLHHSSFWFVLAACLGTVSATAQTQSTVVIPNGAATTEGNDFNNFPWGRGGSGLLHQSIYDAVNFTAQGINHPITITRLRWRPDDMRSSIASSYSTATVKLSTCPLASTAVTQTFANQRGADVTTVFSGPVSWPAFAATPGPCPFHIDIPLTTPFTYDPGLGAGLNIEVDLPIQAFTGTTPLQLDVKTFGANASRVWLSTGYVNGGPNATTPFSPWIPHGVVVELSYSVPQALAAVTPYGTGCYDRPNSAYELFTAAPFDLGGSGMTMLYNGSTGYFAFPLQTSYIPPPATATWVQLGDDTEANVVLSSPLIHPGGSTSTLVVCSNGFVSAGPGNGTDSVPTIAGFLGFPQTCWVADWHDYNPSPLGLGTGNIRFHEAGSVSCVTWDAVPTFPIQNPNTVQIQFDRSNGNVHVVWHIINDVWDHMVGFKVGGPALDPGNRDFSATLSSNFFCGRDDRSLRLTASARPITGTTINLNTTEIGGGAFGANILSLTTINPGIELSVLGMPNCFALVGLDLLSVHLPAAGAFSAPLAIPANPALTGLHLGNQSAIFGDLAANAAGIRTSNALDLRIGIQ